MVRSARVMLRSSDPCGVDVLLSAQLAHMDLKQNWKYRKKKD
jgi:hypothetical protein